MEFGKYNIDGTVLVHKIVGIGNGVNNFTASNPDITSPGSSNISSAAHNIGVFNEFTNLVGTKLQILLKAIDTHITALVDTIDGIHNKSGVENIVSGNNTVSITFTTPFSNSNYSVVFSLENATDTTQYNAMLTTKTTTGFIITLSGSVSTVNYKINWKATKG